MPKSQLNTNSRDVRGRSRRTIKDTWRGGCAPHLRGGGERRAVTARRSGSGGFRALGALEWTAESIVAEATPRLPRRRGGGIRWWPASTAPRGAASGARSPLRSVGWQTLGGPRHRQPARHIRGPRASGGEGGAAEWCVGRDGCDRFTARRGRALCLCERSSTAPPLLEAMD